MLSLLGAFALFPAMQAAPVVCPVMGHPAHMDTPALEYAGVSYRFCCPGCDTQFKANPKKFIKMQADAGSTTGIALFDVVSGKRIDAAKAIRATSDYKGIRYLFATEAEKATFDADPAKYAKAPSKESLVCAVSGESIASYGLANSYQDYKGVRYYFCCGMCPPKFAANPGKFASGVAKDVKAPAAVAEKPAGEGMDHENMGG